MSTPPSLKEAGKTSVEVSLLGQKLLVRTDGDARHVQRLAAYVRRKIDELATQGPLASNKLAVLAALNIAEDYFRALDEMRELKRQVAQKSRALLAELDE